MANHCWNYADFWGNPESLRRLLNSLEALEKKEIEDQVEPRYRGDNNVFLNGVNLHKILSESPLNVRQTKGLNADIYELYGSKWFDCYWEVTEENGVITNLNITGDSAWSPMVPLFQKICKKLKLQCSGNYEESGMDFAGEYEINEFGDIMENQMTYRQYQAISNPNSYFEDVLNNIEEGFFISLEDIYAEFEHTGMKLTDKQKKLIEETYNQHLKQSEK